eukprot:1225119-Pyramimonas_sp.AAC.1
MTGRSEPYLHAHLLHDVVKGADVCLPLHLGVVLEIPDVVVVVVTHQPLEGVVQVRGLRGALLQKDSRTVAQFRSVHSRDERAMLQTDRSTVAQLCSVHSRTLGEAVGWLRGPRDSWPTRAPKATRINSAATRVNLLLRRGLVGGGQG